ncbi:imidazolonepropionase [Candidatus Palauibacter sp.]|uniref:imidazolonepropionase n=1 Tax=Candidatus Palauibacter sp. TaxID=3101350 RepID=UPI003B59683A
MPRLENIGCLATCASPSGQDDIGLIHGAALVWQDGVVRWTGPASALPAEYAEEPAWDAGGRLVIPGLVDAHTHLAFGGWRAGEFSDRIRGRSYLEVAADGGGIASTVRATRALDEETLVERSRRFLSEMVSLGVTTVEAKSGYGLDLETELRLLRVYRRLDEIGPARVVATCLAAHVIPPEWKADRSGYVDLIVAEILPEVASQGLADFCDVFVEDSAFSADEARRILARARELGLEPKLHVDQLTGGTGAELAASVGATSADHLECVSEAGIRALADAGVVAVTLPIATLYLDQTPPPARALIDDGVAVAVATDFNPGTAPSYHLPLAMALACTRQRMTPAEVLKGATRFAARAIGREGTAGSLEPGGAADFAVIDAPDVEHWLYHLRPNACTATVIGGDIRHGALRAAGGGSGSL